MVKSKKYIYAPTLSYAIAFISLKLIERSLLFAKCWPPISSLYCTFARFLRVHCTHYDTALELPGPNTAPPANNNTTHVSLIGRYTILLSRNWRPIDTLQCNNHNNNNAHYIIFTCTAIIQYSTLQSANNHFTTLRNYFYSFPRVTLNCFRV